MKKRAAKSTLAVFRQSGDGYPASIGTTPPNDITAKRIVHPSMLTLPWPDLLFLRRMAEMPSWREARANRNLAFPGQLKCQASKLGRFLARLAFAVGLRIQLATREILPLTISSRMTVGGHLLSGLTLYAVWRHSAKRSYVAASLRSRSRA